MRRSWRLNERHYGALQGKCGQQTRHEFGDAQYMLWRSSCDVPTPPLDTDSEWATGADPRYRDLTPNVLPGAECLKDVLERLLPYWRDPMVPNLCTHGAELDARLRRSAQTLGRTAGVPG